MINVKKNKNIDAYNSSYIVTMAFFAILLAICLGIFYAVNYEASIIVLNFMRAIGYILAFVSAVLVCFRCAMVGKLKNPDGFSSPRDIFYYLKRMGFIVIMMLLMNIACSMGVFWVSYFFMHSLDQIDNLFVRELIMKLPFFVLYLAAIYGTFQKYGFMDSQKKIYNMNFRALSIAITFMTMVPGAVHDNFAYIRAIERCDLNIWTIFGPHNRLYTMMENGRVVVNENFNVLSLLPIVFAILGTFAAVAGLSLFAYNRGKRRFKKDYLTRVDEYETDENI